MTDVSREYEAAALRAFRSGSPAPLLALAPDALERVLPLMTPAELFRLSTLRRRSCRHAATTLNVSIPGIGLVVHTLRCSDCGEQLKRLDATSGDPPSIGIAAPQSRPIALDAPSGISASNESPPGAHEPMNIVLVDDHRSIREGLRALLASERDLHIAGEAEDGRTAIELCATLLPDVVVMDITMPHLDGTEATRQVTRRAPETKVVALSMNHERHFVRAMFEAGAWAYCVKSSAGDEVVRAIRAVLRHEKFVSPAVADAVLDEFVGPSGRHE